MIKRTKRKVNFTVIGNEILQSKELSFTAKGLLCYILSLPDDWVLHKTWLQKEFKVSRRLIDRIFKEIETAGYMHSLDMIIKNRRFVGKNYLFYDTPTKSEKLAKSSDARFETAQIETAQNVQLISTNINKEPIEQNKHTQATIENFDSVQASNNKQLPKWMAGITGTVAERFNAFNKLASEIGKKEGASANVVEQLVNTYATDDRQYNGYMRFETERYFDIQLMMRKFISQQEKYDEKFNY